MQSVKSKNILCRWSSFLTYRHKNAVLETQSDISTSVTFQKYLLIYSHFCVVCDSFWHIRKCNVSSLHSDLSIHTSLLHSDLTIIIPFRKCLPIFSQEFFVGLKITPLEVRDMQLYCLCFIRGCCSGGLWYFRGVPDIIIRHMASFPTRRLKIFVVYKAYVIFQNAFTVDWTMLYVIVKWPSCMTWGRRV